MIVVMTKCNTRPRAGRIAPEQAGRHRLENSLRRDVVRDVPMNAGVGDIERTGDETAEQSRGERLGHLILRHRAKRPVRRSANGFATNA
jgi:hypothetical protein